jgi:hypothetical protein
VVINGRPQPAGVTATQVERLVHIAGEARGWNPPQVHVRANGRVAVGSGPRPRGGAEVFLIRFDPRSQATEVRDGDNRGQTIVQRNVVRQVVRLGAWNGRPVLLRAPAGGDDGLRTLILVQAVRDGRVLAAHLQE